MTILFTHIDKWAKLKRQALRDSALKEVLDSTRAQASLMVRDALAGTPGSSSPVHDAPVEQAPGR